MIFGISYSIPEVILKLSEINESTALLAGKYHDVQYLCSFFKVKVLYLVGSAARAQHQQGEDFDFLVDFTENNPDERAKLLIALKNQLNSMFNIHIDLYEINDPEVEQPIHHKSEKILIYRK
ncbi:nucleotidyltransferase family protein [Schleiferia thermophila]|jgi:predicted nucleotidyltransferase|uniref:nucleotidyltransferase family protein n=1 Tax=Schleiferia thermophila TaxID=884107 RepID=UPI0004E69E70|nr:nucleotidyltransferase domain-containing protein [Schleiferia thermophila]KFD40003.1 DNA polymerase III subunit beta [Schleiferia thermophila str. Yellowstone]